MKNSTKNLGFTLVELLVVITILSIISVVAYQNFGGAVDKAVSGRKVSDVSTIESSLQQYKVDKNYYPKADAYNASTDMWGYNNGVNANPSNSITATYPAWSEEIDSVTWDGGGRVMGKLTWSTKQVGSKWTISQLSLTKRYLTKDLYDPELWDIKVGADTMITSGIGKYVYGVFKKPLSADTTWGATNKKWTYYNIAYTIKKDGTDDYITKIVWDYDAQSCFDEEALCPDSLIWSWDSVLADGVEVSASDTSLANQGIPYPVDGY